MRAEAASHIVIAHVAVSYIYSVPTRLFRQLELEDAAAEGDRDLTRIECVLAERTNKLTFTMEQLQRVS